jgi:hypothetical protein
LELKQATNNAVDLRLLFPLVFAGYSLFLVDRKKNHFIFIMLLLASLHTFVTLHQPVAAVTSKK